MKGVKENMRKNILLLKIIFLIIVLSINVYSLSTDRIANCFDTSEDIVVNISGGATTANWSISNIYNETISGSEPVVGGKLRIPAYFMTTTKCTLNVTSSSDSGTLDITLVPGVIRYSDHLVSPIWQHQTPTISSQFAEQAYFLLQLGFGGTNFGDINYNTTDNNWLNFQKAMCAQGLYAFAKEGWDTTWPLTAQKVQDWGNWLLNNGINNLVVTLGNEPADGGFWTAGADAFRQYVNLVTTTLKPMFTDEVIGAPDEFVEPSTRDSFYDPFFRECVDNLDIFAIHYPSLGVDSGATEGDVWHWTSYMKQKGYSRPMTDGEIHVGNTGGIHDIGLTYWHANKQTGSWPSVETACVGSYVRGVLRLDIFNPSYLGQPLWDGKVNPYRQPLSERINSVRTLSDNLAGTFPLGRIDVGDNLPSMPELVRTEIWALKRGNYVGLYMWTNEAASSNYFTKVEIRTAPNTDLEIVDDQGNVSKYLVDSSGIFYIRISKFPVYVYGFPDIPIVRNSNFSNRAPKIYSTPVTEAVVGGRYLYHIIGYDAEDCPYYWNRHLATFSLSTAPSGMTIGSYSGRIEWKPTTTGNYNVTVVYRDPEGLQDTQSFTINVKPSGENVAPYFVSNPCRFAPINRKYFYTAKAIDPNGDTLTYSLLSGPAGMTCSTTGYVTWTPTTSQGVTVSIQASDNKGGTATQTFHLASGIVPLRQRGGWPNPPTNLTATPGVGGTIVLNWQHTSDNSKGDREEKGFVIERSSVQPPSDINSRHGTGRYNFALPFEMVHVTEADVTTWTDNPGPGKFLYRVKAVNHVGDWGGYTNIVESSTGTVTNTPPNAPTNLRCNGANNPAGITDFTPDLSWTFSDPNPGDSQSAYQILVANSLTNINNNNGNMWNTNKVSSSVNVVTYGGQQLQINTTYYWKVVTWDLSNSSGPYSTVASFSMTGSTPPANTPPNAPINLRCNGQVNPSGIPLTAPVLSWSFSDPDTGDSQSGYKLLVANSLTNINNNNGNIWDTGKVNSSANSVNYGGQGLQYNTTYYWKVMTWDNYASSGPYSTVASFTTTTQGQQQNPIILVSTDTLDFGTLDAGQKATLTFDITNTGGGTLTGSITTDQEWIKVDSAQFSCPSGNGTTINVTVDNSVLNQKEGQYTGTITIVSNGGTATVNVILTATCVLVKPNPYNPNKGLLTFFGDGIVPGETTIKIYTLSGELVKDLSAKIDELVWDGKTENGEPVATGIYLYTYESPKEKGVGKFTVIIK